MVKQCIAVTNTQAKAYWIGLAMAQSSAALNVLYQRLRSSNYQDWEFPYGPFTILNATYSPNYELLWFYQQLSVGFVGFRFATIDLITAAFLVHITFQLKIVQYSLGKIGNSSSSSPKERSDFYPDNWIYLHKILKRTVDYHLAILDIAKEMEEVFSFLLLIVFLGTLGMICFVVYKASLLPVNDIRLPITLMEGIVAALQVFIVCYWGDQVIHESLEVGYAAYRARFVGTDVQFQKSLAFIIQRSQIPVKLTAAKFADVCITSFARMLRSSYSMFMVLRNTNS